MALVAGGLPLIATPAQSQQILSSVAIECDLPRCEDPGDMARLVSLTDLVVDKVYESEMGQAAVYFLEQTGFFEAGSVRLTETAAADGGLDIVIRARGQTYIREVEIEAGLSLEREVEQRLFMRPGQIYDEDDLPRQIESIRAVFERDGYYDAYVQIIAVEVEPYLVDLVVIINKRDRLDVRDIYVRGHEALSYREIRSILLGEFGFFRTYTRGAFNDGLEALIETYRDHDFLMARITRSDANPDPEAGVIDLYVEVREGPRWDFTFTCYLEDDWADVPPIERTEGRSCRVFDRGDLMEALPFLDIGYVDDAEVAASVEDIEALYRTAGYYFADVLNVSQERVGDGMILVRYAIHEGAPAQIREVHFEGNELATEAELLPLMQTRVYGALDTGGFLQPEQLDADIRTIEAYYHQLGHLAAYVPRWSVVAGDNDTALYITIFIEEGPRTRVDDVRFRGHELFSREQLQRGLSLGRDRIFSSAGLAQDQALIRSRYLSRGHRLRKSDTVCFTPDGSQVACRGPTFPRDCVGYEPDRCTDRRRGELLVQECARIVETLGCELSGGILSDRVTIEHRFAEGELVTMGEIFVMGNYETDEDVIRNEIRLRPGDAYNPALLVEGQASLRSLGLFNSVRVDTIGTADTAPFRRSRAAVIVRVEETGTEFIELRVGLVSQNRVDSEFRVVGTTELGYLDRNFLGRALELQLLGGFDADVVGASQVADGEFAATAAVIIGDPRFDWFNTADDPWELRATAGYRYDLLSDVLHVILIQGEGRVRQEFEAIDGLFFSFAINVTRAETRQPEEEDFEDRLILRLEPSLILDRRDSPLNPSRGYRAEVVVELADRFFGASVDAVEFTKIRLAGSYLVPFARQFVLGFHTRFGFAVGGVFSGFVRPESPDDGIVLPPSERFRLGGVAGLRGFPDSSLGPAGVNGDPIFGDVFVTATAELRFPLVPSIDLFGAYFLETGQLSAGFENFRADGFRYTTGLGLRLLAFGLIPIVFDYGLVLDRQVGESIGQLHFNVGYSF